MKAQRKGSNDDRFAKLADHQRRMDQYIAAGFSRNEASRRALLDMESVNVAKRVRRDDWEPFEGGER